MHRTAGALNGDMELTVARSGHSAPLGSNRGRGLELEAAACNDMRSSTFTIRRRGDNGGSRTAGGSSRPSGCALVLPLPLALNTRFSFSVVGSTFGRFEGDDVSGSYAESEDMRLTANLDFLGATSSSEEMSTTERLVSAGKACFCGDNLGSFRKPEVRKAGKIGRAHV